ncbi:hypothetical protein PCYB_125320 [Plasmodium cynomolgi strain B]|uniref:Uncharacterized protein n=1 Tax=Plasmodium cynomolgi (strain B) TaxID=1120755 RepID=K6UE96_PLACD|nr:hypothetical protein PCYB_125320 [Plasmodium cynomolgi strain B]GAB67966.1 hypothetical protein PCYB_125320 [Plasmodium cynomolgi strain B]
MEKDSYSKRHVKKIDNARYTHMINNGNIKNEMEQFCKFFQYDNNNNSFLCNDYCEYMNNFFANEAQMYFGAKFHFDSFDKFTNLPVLTPICKLSNFKKIKREYFAKGEKNRYGKNALFKKIIKNHLHFVEKYTRKLGTSPREEFAKFRKRDRRGENGFPIKSKSVLRKYFNIGGENSRTGKNSQNRGNVVKPNHNDGPQKKKILHRDPQMSRDEKGKFLKRINLHFSNCESSDIDFFFSPDDAKGVNGLFLLRKRQTDQLEEDRDDKSTKSEGVYRNAQFVPQDQRVQIVSYDDMEFYKLMRKRLRDKYKNEAGFSTTSRGKTNDKQEGEQIEPKVYTLLSPKKVQTHLERNNVAQNGNGQLFVNLGRVKYKCLNKYHSLWDHQNGFYHGLGENNTIGMAKPHYAGTAGGTTKWCCCSDSDVSFSNLQKICGRYFSEGGTPNGMNSSQMGYSNGNDPLYGKVTNGHGDGNENGHENGNKFYITSSTTCTSASKSEANPIDDISNDERKDGSVSSEQCIKMYEEGNMEKRNNDHTNEQANVQVNDQANDRTNDIHDVGTHFFVNNLVQPPPMGESGQGDIRWQSKLSEKVPKIHFKHAQVEEDKLNIYHNERLCSVSWDYQRGRSSNLGDRRVVSPHGSFLSPCGVRVHHPERSYVSVTHSQCNCDPFESLLKKSLNEEENKMENNPHEGRGTLGEEIPSDGFDQEKLSCKNGKIRRGTNPIILETPQLENKQKFALKPKVYWSKRRPFWEEKNLKGGITKKKKKEMSNGINTNYHHCGKGSLKNVKDDYAHSEKNVLAFNRGEIHTGCGFTEGEKQPLRSFSFTSDSTCTLRSTPMHKRTLTNELFSPRERRIIRSSGNIQKRSYTTSCINETHILTSRKNLSANIVSLVDANKYDSMRSISGQSCMASSRESSTRLSSNRTRVGRPRRGERDTRGLRTSHSYDGSPLNVDLLPPTIVENDSHMENGSNEICSNRSENKTKLKSIYTKRVVDKKEEPFIHTKGTTTWGKQHGMVPSVNDNSLYDNLLTRGGSRNGVAISVGVLNEKSQLGTSLKDDSTPSDHKERCCYADGRLDYSRKAKDHPSSRKRCTRVADLEQVNKKTLCVEGGTGGQQSGEQQNGGQKSGGQQSGGSYDQVEGLKLGKNNQSGTSPKKIESMNKSDYYHLGRDLDMDNLTSRTNFPVDFFNMNERRDTKDVIAATGRKNPPPTSLHIQKFEYSFPNENNCEAVPTQDDGHCNDELPNSLNNPPPEGVKNSTRESFPKKSSQNSYLIEWYPGFDIPIGTYGRAILRKALHQKRMTDVKMCDELLSSNGLFPTSRSTFGDMKIRDLYRAAHILGVWNVAEKYCLLACERNGYKREWIAMLKRSGVKITIKALKELRSRGVQPGGPMLEAPSGIRKKVSHSPNCSHDDKAGTTPRDCLHNPKCKRGNQTSYHIDEQQTHLSTVEPKKVDTKRIPNQLNCTLPRNTLPRNTLPRNTRPSEHMGASNEAHLRMLKKNQVGITNDGNYQNGSGRVGKTDLDFADTHKGKFPSPPHISNTNVLGYTTTSNHMSVASTSNSLSTIQFGYSTQKRFSNMVVGPIGRTLSDDPEISNEMIVENSNRLQNTCHFFDTNFLHARRKLIHENWNCSGTASLGDTDHTAGITVRGDNKLHSGNITVMGDLSTYEGMRKEHALEMGMLSDLFHMGGTSDSFQFWSNSKNGSRFVDEYM